MGNIFWIIWMPKINKHNLASNKETKKIISLKPLEEFLVEILITKELTFCHRLWFSNFNIVATQKRRPLIFQTMNAVRSNNVSLKYQRFTSSGYKVIGFTKIEFVAKSQFQLLADFFKCCIRNKIWGHLREMFGKK